MPSVWTKAAPAIRALCSGYATNETPELLPIPFAVATEFLQLLKITLPGCSGQTPRHRSATITTAVGSPPSCVPCNTGPDVGVGDFRHIVESMMVLAACKYGIKGDFEKLVHPTGRFVVGGSFADCGVTGGSWPVIPMAASAGLAVVRSLERPLKGGPLRCVHGEKDREGYCPSWVCRPV